MTFNPHLVVDGVLAAAAAVGATQAVVAVGAEATRARASLDSALAERRSPAERIQVVSVPDRFVAGEESALVHWLNGGEAKPTFTPPRPFEKGVDGRPTLVQNVETLANLGLIARYGGDWFRERGTADEPGTALVTVLGGVDEPGVVEVEIGTPLGELFERCGGLADRARAVLVGGYFGTWIRRDLEAAARRRRAAAARRGRRRRSPFSRKARAAWPRRRGSSATWQARAPVSAGRASSGSPAVADALEQSRPRRRTPAASSACRGSPRRSRAEGPARTPTARLRLVDSALSVFAPEIERHLAGRCALATARRSCRQNPCRRTGDERERLPARQPDPLRRARPLRGAAPRADRARRVGLPDHRGRADPARPRAGGPTGGLDVPAPRTRARRPMSRSDLHRRVRDRDRNPARVRRVTAAVAAASVGACAALAGLAVGSTSGSRFTTATTTTQRGTTEGNVARHTSTGVASTALSPASTAPVKVTSSSTPVATSGGS